MAGENPIVKKTKGKQKIEMKRIENEDDRLITFSKRKSGIYKKASELVTMTGAQVAFLVYSPAGKPFSFSHPSMDVVANRFLGKEPTEENINSANHPLFEAQRLVRIEELNQQHNDMLQQLEIEKEKGKQLKLKHKQLRGNDQRKGWWDQPIEELNVQELLQMETACKEIRTTLLNKIKEKTNNGATSSSDVAVATVAGGVNIGDGFVIDQSHRTGLYHAHMNYDHVQMNTIEPFASTNVIDPQNNPTVFPPRFDYGHGPHSQI